jgi:hypothetical protein
MNKNIFPFNSASVFSNGDAKLEQFWQLAIE